jgi:hypothetical protein
MPAHRAAHPRVTSPELAPAILSPMRDRDTDLSRALAAAPSAEARARIWRRYLEEEDAEFAADCASVADDLVRGDLDAVAERANDYAVERAAARVEQNRGSADDLDLGA